MRKCIRVKLSFDNEDYSELARYEGLSLDDIHAFVDKKYKPDKPLIKNEKIREAVREWADGNNIKSVHYDAFWRGFRRDNSSITVWEELPLEDNKVYTIAELCGEEKE